MESWLKAPFWALFSDLRPIFKILQAQQALPTFAAGANSDSQIVIDAHQQLGS